MSEYPYRCRTGNQQGSIPDPVRDGGGFANPSTPIEKPDIQVSDQHQTGQNDPEDPVGRLKKAAPLLNNEYDREGENKVTEKHPPEPRPDPR
jgi:hypothetical protein